MLVVVVLLFSARMTLMQQASSVLSVGVDVEDQRNSVENRWEPLFSSAKLMNSETRIRREVRCLGRAALERGLLMLWTGPGPDPSSICAFGVHLVYSTWRCDRVLMRCDNVTFTSSSEQQRMLVSRRLFSVKEPP